MKRIPLLLVTILSFLETFAQDKILLRDGNEMQVSILELRPDSVFFSNPTDSDSKKIESLARTAIFSITFQNGKVELMAATTPQDQQIRSELELYELGRRDAKKNHKAIGAFAGTAGATILLGFPLGLPAGLATGAALGYTNVPEKRIKPSEPQLLQYQVYREGYINQAKKKKRTNAVAGFATGAGVWTAMVIAMLIAFNHT